MHGGKSVASALKLRTDYAMNPDKTENGKLISAFACDPHTADAEFLLSKRQYRQFTGREQTSDVISTSPHIPDRVFIVELFSRPRPTRSG